MNINLKKDDITTILDALETYQIDIEHWENCKTTAVHVENLINYLTNTLEKNNVSKEKNNDR
jgi:hypothetical protein